MTDITISMSKQLEEDMIEKRVESERSIDDVLSRFDVRKTSSDMVSLGNSFYQIVGVASGKVDQLLRELQNIEGIEAAYVKPADELP